MEEALSALLEWVRLNPVWAGLAVFAVSLIESLAIVGMIVPGVVILFGVGAMISTGVAGFWEMAGWAVAGAIIGDVLSYWLGRRYKDDLPQIWPFSRFPKALAQGEQFFVRYGALSVAFARFFGPGRATVPLVAGMLAMRPGPFLAANIGSAVLWGPAFLLPGVLFGASMEIASEVALGLVVLLTVLVALIWLTGWIAHRLFRWFQPHAGEFLGRLLALGRRLPWLGRIAEAIGNPGHPEASGLAVYAGLLMLSAGGLFIASPLLSMIHAWSTGDVVLARALASVRNDVGDQLLLPLTHWDKPTVIASVGGCFGAALAMARRWRALAHWSVSVVFALSVSGLLHALQAGPQSGGLAPDPGVLSSGVLLGLAIVIAVRPVPMSLRWTLYSTGVVLVALGGFARLYFALTNLGGILTASLLAIAWVGGIGVAYRTHALAEFLSGKVAVFSLVGLLIGYSLATQIAPHEIPKTQAPEPVVLTESAWREHGWRNVSGVRSDLRRQSDQPLNLQYAGDLATLGKILGAAGWQANAPLPAADLARLLSPSTPLARLPLLPHVYENARESAAWVKNVGEERWVVRLWPSGYTIEAAGPLWLGSVSAQRKQRRFKLLTFAVTTKSFERPLRSLRTDLGHRVVTIAAPTATSPWLFKPPR